MLHSLKLRTSSAVMVVYHSINRPEVEAIRIPNMVRPEYFEQQIRYFAENARVIALDQYLDCRVSGKPLPESAVILTFDDGYRDNFTTAYPLLKQYGLPATFFLATDYIGSGKAKWEDRLSCLIRRTHKAALRLTLPDGPITLSLASHSEKVRAINGLVRLLGAMPANAREAVLREVEAEAESACADCADNMMTWDQVRELAHADGFSIGAHTASHCHLSRVCRDQVEQEIARSTACIEAEIHQKVRFFAYPYGDFNAASDQAVRQSGLEAACTLEYGSNPATADPFLLKRVSASNQKGLRFLIGLRLRSSVLGQSMKQIVNWVTTLGERARPLQPA